MHRSWIPLLLTAVVAAPLSAGIVYEIEVTDHGASPPKTESVEAVVEGKNIKMGVTAGRVGGRGKMIFRGDRREMVIVDDDDKSYTVIDDEAFEAIGAMAGQMSAALEEALKNVPPDQRAEVEKMMKGRGGAGMGMPPTPTSALRRTGERGEKAGYPCVKYEVLRGGEKVQELWVTDWSNLEGGAEVAAAFEELAGFFEGVRDSFASASGGAFPAEIGDNAFEHMKEMGGFPVVSRDFEGGELEEESTLRSTGRRTLDPADFEPPAGYKRRQMFQ